MVDDLQTVADQDQVFAKTLQSQWEYPLDLMFLTTEGDFVSKLNSFRDLPQAHPDVGYHGDPFVRFGNSTHADVFLKHAQSFVDHWSNRTQ